MRDIVPAQLFSAARAGGYALAALNAVNLETAQAVVRAAEAERAPVVLQFSQNAARYGELETLLAIGRQLRAQASVPVVVHFDHAEDRASALRALELGCDSVMLESGDLSPQAYADELGELARVAHARGAVVEGEFEVVAKGDRAATFTDPQLLADLAQRSACDLVVVDVGSVHKLARKEAQLDLGRLQLLGRAVPQPLVLHGSSGVPDDQIRRAVGLGVSKINVATSLMNAFTDAAAQALASGGSRDPRRWLGAAREAMSEAARSVIRLSGSSGLHP